MFEYFYLWLEQSILVFKLPFLILQFDVLFLFHFYGSISLRTMVDARGSQAVLPQFFEIQEVHGYTWRPLKLQGLELKWVNEISLGG